MSRSTFRVLFYLKRNTPKKNGLVPVMCRITVNGKISQFSCKLDVEEKLWNVSLGRMSGRSLVDAYSDFIQHSIGFLCNNASSRHSDEIEIPQLFLHIQFATELGNLAVYGDTAHYRYKPALLRGIAFEIE